MIIDTFIPGFIFPHECAYKKSEEENYYVLDANGQKIVVVENVAGDDGGATKYGIDTASHPGVDVANLTADQAIHIYMAEFGAIEWSIPNSPSALAEFPGNSGFAFFDAREVCGLHEAWLLAQRALGINDDGIPGNNTRQAIKAAPPNTFLSAMIEERRNYHKYLANKFPHDAQFLKGWLNRCDELESYLLA